MISYDDFLKVDIRVGRIVDVKDFPKAKKPAYQLWIDFGPELGIKQSSAQITGHKKEELLNSLIVAVTNFASKNVAGFESQVLVLGTANNEKTFDVIRPNAKAKLGSLVR